MKQVMTKEKTALREADKERKPERREKVERQQARKRVPSTVASLVQS